MVILFIMAAYITYDHSDTFHICGSEQRLRRGQSKSYGDGVTGANHTRLIPKHAG